MNLLRVGKATFRAKLLLPPALKRKPSLVLDLWEKDHYLSSLNASHNDFLVAKSIRLALQGCFIYLFEDSWGLLRIFIQVELFPEKRQILLDNGSDSHEESYQRVVHARPAPPAPRPGHCHWHVASKTTRMSQGFYLISSLVKRELTDNTNTPKSQASPKTGVQKIRARSSQKQNAAGPVIVLPRAIHSSFDFF